MSRAAPEPGVDDELRELEEVARGLTQHTLLANTRRACAKVWHSFERFCDAHGLEPLPAHPEAMRWYLA